MIKIKFLICAKIWFSKHKFLVCYFLYISLFEHLYKGYLILSLRVFFLCVTLFNIHTTISRFYYRQTDTLPQLTIRTPVNVRKWFVLISSFFNMMITGGFPFNMSVLFVEFLNAFGKSKAETSLVQSVCTGVFFIGGKSGPWVIGKLYCSILSTKKENIMYKLRKIVKNIF